ncbi:hypothetical protein FIBSPDRAFT_1050600 [Athelia psychrophila]|uniref:Uncharacterized protein n=1 Tax=Athelia psychrophila TaxID=1759441 RepID=A0A166AJY8_9AGAM|nr:hypothetical protein FIBSPDRAFT_1050600 [Fibularhizoctonia sp. CBS 109695]
MHSYIYTAAIALCFGAVSSALPVPQSNDAAALVAGVAGDVSNIVNAFPTADVKKLVSDTVENTLNLRDSPTSLPTILQGVLSQIGPLAAQISFTTAANATEAALGPIASSLEAILSAGAAEVEKLVGQPLDIILGAAGDGGKTAAADLAKTVSDLVTTIVNALGQLDDLEAPKIKTLITTLFTDTETALVDFLKNADSAATGLKSQLVTLLTKLGPTLYNLNLAEIVAFLGLPALD